jgi:hypothetical protein
MKSHQKCFPNSPLIRQKHSQIAVGADALPTRLPLNSHPSAMTPVLPYLLRPCSRANLPRFDSTFAAGLDVEEKETKKQNCLEQF